MGMPWKEGIVRLGVHKNIPFVFAWHIVFVTAIIISTRNPEWNEELFSSKSHNFTKPLHFFRFLYHYHLSFSYGESAIISILIGNGKCIAFFDKFIVSVR